MSQTTLDAPEAEAVPRRRWRLPVGTFWVAILAYVGVLVMPYPTGASWYSQVQQSRLIVTVEESLVQDSRSTLDTQLALAHEYNRALSGGAILASGSNVPMASDPRNAAYDYDSILRATADGVMARLRIDAISLDLPIYHGTSDTTLEKGVGHLEGTALPVGGASTRSV